MFKTKRSYCSELCSAVKTGSFGKLWPFLKYLMTSSRGTLGNDPKYVIHGRLHPFRIFDENLSNIRLKLHLHCNCEGIRSQNSYFIIYFSTFMFLYIVFNEFLCLIINSFIHLMIFIFSSAFFVVFTSVEAFEASVYFSISQRSKLSKDTFRS